MFKLENSNFSSQTRAQNQAFQDSKALFEPEQFDYELEKLEFSAKNA